MSLSTAGEITDRVYREWLHRADDQPIRTQLSADFAAGVATLTFRLSHLAEEEQNLFTVGSIVEVGQELMRVTTVNLTNQALTVTRGVNGTTDADHVTGDELRLAPHFPRRVVFDAVADAIVDLYPDLWHTRTTEESLSRDWVEVPESTYAVTSALTQHRGEWVDAGARYLGEFPDSRTGKAVQFTNWASGTVILRVKQRFTRPTAESDEISDIEPDWEQLVVIGAVVNILGATDVDAVSQDFVTEAFQQQGYPVGSGERLSRAAIRLYEYKLDKARREMKVRYATPTVMSGVTYGGF